MPTCPNCTISPSDVPSRDGPVAIILCALHEAAPVLLSKLSGSLAMMQALRLVLVGAPGWNADAESHLLAYMGEVRAALALAQEEP